MQKLAETSAFAVIPKPAQVRDRRLIEMVGEKVGKPSDSVTVTDMHKAAREELTRAVDSVVHEDYEKGRRNALDGQRLVRWLDRNT